MSFICFKSVQSYFLLKRSFAERLDISLLTCIARDTDCLTIDAHKNFDLSSPEIDGEDKEEFLNFLNVSGIDAHAAESLRQSISDLASEAIEDEPEEDLRGSLWLSFVIFLFDEAGSVDDPSIRTFHKYGDDYDDWSVTDREYRSIARLIIVDHTHRVCRFVASTSGRYDLEFETENDDPSTRQAIQESFDEVAIGFRAARKSAIESMLKETAFEQRSDSEEKRNCVICLEDFVAEAKLASLPCRHEFHGECIVRWLETNHVCPLCRFQIPFETEE